MATSFSTVYSTTYLVNFKKPQKHSPKVPPLSVNFTFRGYVYLAIYVPAIISSR